MKTLEMAGLNSVSYFTLVVNMRAVAQANYLATFLSDVALGFLAFTIVKRIAHADTLPQRFGYAIGGAAGAQLGIFLTKVAFGH